MDEMQGGPHSDNPQSGECYIARLPVEILSQIFIHTGAFGDTYTWHGFGRGSERLRLLVTLQVVCWEWRVAARTTKELWRRFISADQYTIKKPAFRAYLRNVAHSWPLDLLSGTVPDFHRPYDPIQAEKDWLEFVSEIAPRLEDWEDRDGFLMNEDWGGLNGPVLRTYSNYKVYHLDRTRAAPLIKQGRFPVLERLEWVGPFKRKLTQSTPFLTSVLIFSSPIKKLTLNNCHLYPRDFLKQSQLSPDITDLYLRRVHWYPDRVHTARGSHESAREFVHLPKLATLNLTCSKREDAFGIDIVYYIAEQAPALRNLFIGQIGEHCAQYKFPGANTISNITFSLRSHGGTLKQSFPLGHSSYSVTANWLTNFKSLEYLGIEGNDAGFGDILPEVYDLLWALRASSHGSLPKLKEITISHCTFPPSILSVFAWDRSLSPLGGLSSGDKFSPILFTLNSCRVHSKHNSRKVRLITQPIADIYNADWSQLNWLLEGVQDWDEVSPIKDVTPQDLASGWVPDLVGIEGDIFG